jgi:hypothetical protein
MFGTASAMDVFDNIEANFRKGDYRKAITEAIALGNSSKDFDTANDSKLFLKECFPSMLLDDSDLADLQDMVDRFLDGFNFENCPSYWGSASYWGTMNTLNELAKEKFQSTGKEYWKNIPVVSLWKRMDDMVFPAPIVVTPKISYAMDLKLEQAIGKLPPLDELIRLAYGSD